MSFIYNGDPGRVYPSLGLVAEPGNSRDDAEPLDWRWTASDAATPAQAAPAASDSATTQPEATADGTTTADPAPATTGGSN